LSDINITSGHIARHTPQGEGAQGRDAAIVDIAQDLLLRHLHYAGILDNLAFKGGTALRKLYAGTAGRFSLDLDFSTADIGTNPDDVLTDLITSVDGLEIGPFRYGVLERRGKWTLLYSHPFGGNTSSLQSKIDLTPPPWLEPIKRGWRPLPIHQQYGDLPLPEIKVIRIEENLAEKIARLNRTTTARDMYDLFWLARNPTIVGNLDKRLIRRLAILKIWTDANGVHAGNIFWSPGHEGPPFISEEWLRDRSQGDFDINDIGTLANPTPTAKELSDEVGKFYSFLSDLDEDEKVLSSVREQDRPLALHCLSGLPDKRIVGIGIY
jgi:predicted nucleotidyltransferase component of viral defense system